MPPVTSTVPSVGQPVPAASLPLAAASTPLAGVVATRASRGALSTPSRSRNSGSPVARAAASSGVGASSSRTVTNRSGFSVCAARTRPHTASVARSSTRLTKTSRVLASRASASHVCRVASASAVAARTSPAATPTNAHSGAVTPASIAAPSAAGSACRVAAPIRSSPSTAQRGVPDGAGRWPSVVHSSRNSRSW